MLLQWRVISREGLSRCTVGWCEFKLSLQITGVSVGQQGKRIRDGIAAKTWLKPPGPLDGLALAVPRIGRAQVYLAIPTCGGRRSERGCLPNPRARVRA